MPKSYNGWSASPNPADFGGLARLEVAGETFAPGVRAGDVHAVFQYLAEQLHRRVEPIVRPDWHQADDWGYSYRKNVNANNLSCHASGTAIDYNATRHPNGKRGTFSAGQVAEIRRILGELEGVVCWGGDFTGTADEMHFEIIKGAGDIARVAAKVRGGAPAPVPPPAPAPPHTPGKFAWNLPAGHYYGNIAGPAKSHGGYYSAERDEVRNIQQWLIYHGCVPGVPSSAWASSGWADGKWEGPTDGAMATWHARFYAGQPFPAQCWRDDYDRLARA
ncbi:hypothetical protein JOF56_003702 [Kibdelosporangium banguiense]|uniref:Peptidase M15C domain-containing protein n=1 Tax=Kibdelosporangium banguiense TaxID=1365924 RepID=A0ABS4TFX3_9PSEU|nr:M15 family metallopeptidase [Kibdelosporangium banguiense]MBP2323317.1 hypothetical protein [Kibdelosporangium banguiense]